MRGVIQSGRQHRGGASVGQRFRTVGHKAGGRMQTARGRRAWTVFITLRESSCGYWPLLTKKSPLAPSPSFGPPAHVEPSSRSPCCPYMPLSR